MPDSEPSHSFDVRTPDDLLSLLRQDHEDVILAPGSSRHSIHAALIAWHLTDWAWVHIKGNPAHLERLRKAYGRIDRDSFEIRLMELCPELGTMKAIANGAKHATFPDDPGGIKDSRLGDDFDWSFAKGFGGRLEIEKDDGSTAWFDDELDAAVRFWTRFLSDYPSSEVADATDKS